ncbi:MAG: hypothetical protein ACO2PN_13550 [Pyrobaculum sp.]|jgi:hypothetical protein
MRAVVAVAVLLVALTAVVLQYINVVNQYAECTVYAERIKNMLKASAESVNTCRQKLASVEAQLGEVVAERDRLEVKVALLQRQLVEMNASLSHMQSLLNAEKTRAASLGAALSAATSALLRYEVPVKVVEEINKARASMGLPQVKLINLTTPWFRAAYLLQHGIFTHYDLEGRHPGYWFTKLDGGLYGFDENIARSICPAGCNPLKEAVENTRLMIYNNSAAGFAHRDSLLDPCNNHAAVAAAWDGGRFYLAVYMLSIHGIWMDPIKKDGERVVGVYLASPDLKPPFYAAVFKDMPSRAYLIRGFYGYGNQTGFYQLKHEPIGGGWHKVYIDVALPNDGALYTVVVLGTNNYTWTPLSPGGQWRATFCRIADYTVINR